MRYFIFLFCCLYINAQEGPKTHIMLQELDKGILLNYDPQKKTFQHQGKEFIPLRGSTQGISHIPVASIGSSPISREIILLDPVTSPLLMQAYDSLSSAEDLMRFIREEVFDLQFSSERAVQRLVDSWNEWTETNEGDLIPVLPIDAFIAAKTGTCRHYAFVTAYFLDRLQKEGVLPEGTSYYVRDIVPGGGHAWNLYILKDESEAWHIDTLWGVNKNLKNKEDLKFLYKFYGIKAINHERKRFLNL